LVPIYAAVKRPSLLLATLVAVLATAAPASAIQFASPDGNAHPQVGLVLFYDASGNPLSRCSGTLLSPTVFLTAGHCTDGTASAQVWFSPGPITTASGYPFGGGASLGIPYTDPLFNTLPALTMNHDLGVVVLSTPQPGPYASLAPVGTLDLLSTRSARKAARFDLVGYGLQDALPPSILAERTRYAGQAKLVNEQSALTGTYAVQLTSAAGTGGSFCFGDSGGPDFLAGTLQVVAVNSFLLDKQHCLGGAFSARTDTVSSRAFIGSFLP
jgi:hypothetical protein